MTTTFPAPGLIVHLRVLFDREDSVQAAVHAEAIAVEARRISRRGKIVTLALTQVA